MKKIQKKLWSLVLCAAFVLSMLPAVSLPADAAGLKPAAIRLDANNSFGIQGAGTNWVYFGRYGGSPNRWRVLSISKSGSYYYDNAGSEYNGNILFLMSESLMGSVKFSANGPSSNVYQGSNLQAFCNTLYGSCFSLDEKPAILSTTKTPDYDPGVACWGSSTLDKDKLFSLSLSEVTNSSYGFKSGAFNQADTARRLNKIWQLRTPSTGSSDIVAVVITDGSMTNGLVDTPYNVRPAFNMNLSPVLFASAAQGGKSASGMDSGLAPVPGTAPTTWKLTLQDKSRTFSATPSSATIEAGSTISVNYTGAASGSNEFVSAILTDADGNARYYGRLKNITASGSAAGTVSLTIPADLHAGGYSLKIFSEQYNGDYQTDLASAFSNVALTITTETTPPTVQSVTPASGTGMNPASLTINFSEVMDTAIAGTVTLNNGATASSPLWSNDKKAVTYSISVLTYSTTYNISISGFRDKVGNIMTADSSHTYVTDALKYMDENGAAKTATATKITNSTTSLTTGWYVVESNVTKNATLAITGDVKLILADGCTLTVNGSDNNAGVSVTAGNSLTIYGQSAGTGKLIAIGVGEGAGIGGKRYVHGGAITINGGTITAKGGGDGGAGIGGGLQASSGTTIINAGTVTANGGTCGAGIGSGSYFNNDGSLTINGGTVSASGGAGGSAGIGGGYRGSGGTVTITGGFLWANGTGEIEYGKIVRLAAGIGSGAGGGGVIVTISGGSVNTSIQSTPKNGTANGNAEVKLTKIHLAGVNTITGVTALIFNKANTYGMKDLHTDDYGNLFLHLPSGVSVKSADTGSTVYWGLVTAGTTDGTLSEDSTAPSVQSVTPSGTTTLTVTFSEAMDTAIAGTVTLDNGATVSSPQWSSDCKTITYSLSGLDYSKQYAVSASGFQDFAGHAIAPYTGSFTTEASPVTPGVSPLSLTVNKGGSASTTVNFGQGSSAATGVTVSSDNSAVASVTPTTLSATGSLSVYGISSGTTKINLSFNDVNNTKNSVSVTVLPVAPTWPSGSGLTASSVTTTGATLSWTAASDVTAVTGYKVYQGGKQIGTVASGVTTYTVTGLSASTNYSFQVQAGNADDKWTTDGPTVGVTTTALPSGGSSTAGSTTGGLGTSYQADVTGNGSAGKVPISVDSKSHSATAAIGTKQAELLAGGGILTLSMPSVTAATSYSATIPISSLTATNVMGSLTIKSKEGNITVPSNMLTTPAGNGGQTAQITIGQADTSGLPDVLKSFIGDRPVVQLSLYVDGTQIAWNNPGAPVTISIPYTPSAQEQNDPNGIVIWYIDGSGKLVCMPTGHYDSTTGTVTFTTTHFSLYAVGNNKVSFSDVGSSAWYYDAVSFLASREITAGTGNGAFSPESNLTRGQFIVLLLRAYGIAPDENPLDNFSDAGNTYYTNFLAAAKRLGISSGVGNDLFAPEQQITRQEMFTLLYNALKTLKQLPIGTSGKTLSSFTDRGEIASWAKDAMAAQVEAGIITGNDGNISPTATTTRAEMAQALYTLMTK